MFRPKTVSAIGIDIGSHSIKCVEITHSKGVIKLQRAMTLPLLNPDMPTTALKTFFDAYPKIPKSVRISVAGPSVVIRRITLPIMTHSDLKGAIRFEAENHLPYAIEECVLDFQILNQVPNQTMMNVLLVAVKRDFIQQRLEMLAQVKVQPEIIDLDVFCLSNAFKMLNSDAENKIYGLLNIGHQMSSFVVIQDKLPFFVRDISQGGLSVTNALAELKGISIADAETLKLSREVDVLNDLKAATQKAFEPLGEELKKSIDYCEGELGEPVPSIWLSGGGAASFEATRLLSEAIGKPVSLWNNTKKIELSKDVDSQFLEGHSGEFNVAFGMALERSSVVKMIEINLLPEELRKKEEKLNILAELPIQKSAIIFIVVFFTLQVLASIGAIYLSGHFKWMSKEVAKLTEANKDVLSQKASTALIKKKIAQSESDTKRSFYWSSLLNALSDSITKGVWLTNFSINNDGKVNRLRLEGSVVGKGEETAYTGKFIKELKAKPLFNELFDEIELSTINQKRIKEFDVYDFVILCTFKKGKL